jgi:hypothetical protein
MKKDIRILIIFYLGFCIITCLIIPVLSTSQSLQTTPPFPMDEGGSSTILPTSKPSILETWPAISPLPDISPTQRLSQSPHPTVFPTISSDEKISFSLNLSSQNQICTPPCWMNMVPGKTSFNQVAGFLQSVSSKYKYDYFESSVHYYMEDYFNKQQIEIIVKFEGDTITRLLISGAYPISDYILQNGKPDEIWISISSPLRGNPLIFEMVLFYPSKGMAALYLGEQEPKQSWLTPNLMQLCPFANSKKGNENSLIWINLWPPEENFNFADWYRGYFGHPDNFPINFYALDDASFIDVKDFYEIYGDSENIDYCIPLYINRIYPGLSTPIPDADE